MVASCDDRLIIEETVEKYAKRGFFKNKIVILFGCTVYARNIRDSLKKHNVKVEAIVDNNPNKVGKDCLSVKVYSPQMYLSQYEEEFAIIVCSKYYYEMTKQLNQWGYKEGIHILNIMVSECEILEKDSESELFSLFEQAETGFERYRNILKRYSREYKVLACPYPGTGDIYMACSLLDIYLKQNNISRYILVVIGNNCRKVANLFRIENIEAVSKEEMELMLKAWEFFGTEKMNIKPLLYWGWRTKHFLYADKYPQITFNEMFQYDVYEFADIQMGKRIAYDKKSEYAKNLFHELGLRPGKTVILAPYAGSFASEMGLELWEQLTDRLIERGYQVCTNSCGESEPPIKNTVPVFFPYEEAVNVLEYAGGFVALRSGLCDIVSQADCKMVIIYEAGFNAARYEYFSLRKMKLNESVTELIFPAENIVERIMDQYE